MKSAALYLRKLSKHVVALVTLFGLSVFLGIATSGDSAASDNTELLERLGELIARERAYQEVAQEFGLAKSGGSRFTLDESTFDTVLGTDLLTRYDEILPIISNLGQTSRRDEVALRFDPAIQKQLMAGERVEGINSAAVNNVIAHYKIATEELDTNVRQLLFAQASLLRSAAEELENALDTSNGLSNPASYFRASHLLAAPGQIKGFVQPRCNKESDALKQAKNQRYDIEDKFYFDDAMKLQVSAKEIHSAAELIEQGAKTLSADGSHCG